MHSMASDRIAESPRPRVALYVFQGSHPCEAVLAAAQGKGVEYRRVELPPVLHRAAMHLLRFPAGTVPGMRIGGQRIQGTTAIFHALDALAPGAPLLYPADPHRRARVNAAEAWAAGNLQDSGRRLIWGHLRRSPEALRLWAERTPDPLQRWFKRRLSRPAAWVASTANGATPEAIRRDLRRLPLVLDQVDALISDGVIGGDEPNAADFQVLSTVGLWMVLADLRPAILPRPCGQASARLFPDYVARPGVAAGVLPADWLAPVRAITP